MTSVRNRSRVVFNGCCAALQASHGRYMTGREFMQIVDLWLANLYRVDGPGAGGKAAGVSSAGGDDVTRSGWADRRPARRSLAMSVYRSRMSAAATALHAPHRRPCCPRCRRLNECIIQQRLLSTSILHLHHRYVQQDDYSSHIISVITSSRWCCCS